MGGYNSYQCWEDITLTKVGGYNSYPNSCHVKVGGYSRREKGGSKAAGQLPWSEVVFTYYHTIKKPLWEPHVFAFVQCLCLCLYSVQCIHYRDHYVLGGIHMTNLAYLPNSLLKGTKVSQRRILNINLKKHKSKNKPKF